MSDPALNLPIRSVFDPTGTDAALAALRKLQQEQAKAQPAGGGPGGGGAPFRAASDAAAQAERDTLRYATAMAQAQRATGDTAGAVETLRAAHAQLTPNTIEAHQATARLAQAQTALQKELSGSGSLVQQFGQSLTSSLMNIIGPAALAAGAIKAVGEAGELARLGAQAQQTRQRFDGLAAAANTTGQALLGALRSASAGTISDLNLELAANRAQLLGVADSAQEFSTLMEIARARAQDMGISTTQAFNDLITGLGRGSALILDNLGITVSVTEANKTYAAQLGKNASALTEAEQKQALINAVLTQGKASLDAAGGAAETNATKMERLAASADNLKAAIGGGLASVLGPVADDLARIINALDELQARSDKATNQTEQFRQRMGGTLSILGSYQIGLSGIAAGLDHLSGANTDVGATVERLTGIHQQATAAAVAHTSVTALNSQAMASRAQSAQIAAQAIDTDTQALITNTQQSLQASVQSQQLAQFQATLASLGGQVAGGLLTSAQAAAILANQYNIASGEALQLINLQAQLAHAKVAAQALADQRAGERSGGAFRTAQEQREAAEGARTRARIAQQEADAIAAARREQVMSVGTHQQQLALLRQEYNQAVKLHGANSQEAIRADTALRREQQQRAGGGRGGVGGVKLTDQQKLNNSLLADQEKYQNQAEDAERAHVKKLLDIERDYQEKSLAQQRANEVSKRASRADFYENLTGATKDIGVEEAQALSAEYEAAYQKSQEIAQSGNQKLADDYLKMKQRQLSDEVDYQKRLAQAKKDKDKETEAQLRATHKLRQEQYVEEEKQLLEAGDSNAKERDKQIADENARYDEQSAHIQEQAGRTADAKIDAAKRAGKAIDAENDALERQLDLLGRIKEKAGELPVPAGGSSGESPGESPGGTNEGGTTEGARGLRTSGTRTGLASGGGVAEAIAILQDAALIIVALAGAVRTNQRLVSQLNQYAQVLQNATTVLQSIADLRARLAMPQPPLDMALVQRLAEEQAAVVAILAGSIVPSIFSAAKHLERYKDGAAAATEILKAILELREATAKTQGPIDPGVVQQLAAESAMVTQTVIAQLLPLNQQAVDGLKRYADGAGAAIGILKDTADLGQSLAEPIPPIPNSTIVRLAIAIQQAARAIQILLIPLAQSQAEQIQRYAEAGQSAIGVLKDVSDFGRGLAEPIPPIPNSTIVRLAFAVQEATRAIQILMIPLTEEQAAALQRYADGAGAAIGILKDTADLGKDLASMPPAISPATISRLADTAAQATRIIGSRMVKVSDEQAAAAKRYAETQGAAIQVLKNTLDLPAKLFADYQSPSDAQIRRVVADADRVARQINEAAKAYDTKGLDAAKAFSEAIGGTFSAFKEGLLFFQALSSGDFVLDPKNLAAFERAMGQTIATAGRLGKQAAAIPPANVTALETTARALTTSYESMIKLAAVPFGDLPPSVQNLGGASSMRPLTINIYNPPSNMNVPAVIAQIKTGLSHETGMRRGARG